MSLAFDSIIASDAAVQYSPANFQTVRYGIVRHKPRVAYDVGGKLLEFPPDTVSIQDIAGGLGKGTPIPIFDSCWRLIKASNSSAGYDYARSIGNMWINIDYVTDGKTPRAEAITNGGNFVMFDKLTYTHGHIACFEYDENFDILDTNEYNWHKHPELFFKGCAIGITGIVRNLANGLDVYFPLIRVTDRWINLNSVELFPVLPIFVTYNSQPVMIYDYILEGTSIKGVTDKDVIYLLKSTRPGERIFPTSWRISTLGVIPPA